MTLLSLHELAPVVLAAGEKSKTPFFIAGGVLAGWAVLVSVLGLRQPDFPKTRGASRVVMAISALLVLGAASMAVVTASRPVKSASAATSGTSTGASGTSGASGGGASTVALAADPGGQIRYDTKSLSASAGRVTVRFTNQSSTPHNVTLERAGRFVAGSATITSSQTTFSAPLKPGSYTFYCSVDSHRQLGMQGTLVVR